MKEEQSIWVLMKEEHFMRVVMKEEQFMRVLMKEEQFMRVLMKEEQCMRVLMKEEQFMRVLMKEEQFMTVLMKEEQFMRVLTKEEQFIREKERVLDLLRGVNGDVAFLIAEKGSRSTDIDMILSETAFNDASLLRARYLSCPGWWQGKSPCHALIPHMDEVILPFHQPLERKRLLNRLISLKQVHRKYPYTGNVYHLRARLKFSGENEDDAHLYEVTHVVLSGETSVVQAKRQPTPPGHTDRQTDSCAAFMGCQLDGEHLKNWLRQCTVQLPERKMERTRQSMTKTEMNRIHKEHHLDPLPEGWFYNGHQFVSFDGEKSATHPDAEKFLVDYLDEVNQEVALHNARIDAMDHHDLFD
ncbi:hypothetical protein LSAT2_025838 [Lamellibrachia satsuma]|nr:hypothetical protein LSAT2_025838 [Lamellibrachia satsuma]